MKYVVFTRHVSGNVTVCSVRLPRQFVYFIHLRFKLPAFSIKWVIFQTEKEVFVTVAFTYSYENILEVSILPKSFAVVLFRCQLLLWHFLFRGGSSPGLSRPAQHVSPPAMSPNYGTSYGTSPVAPAPSYTTPLSQAPVSSEMVRFIFLHVCMCCVLWRSDTLLFVRERERISMKYSVGSLRLLLFRVIVDSLSGKGIALQIVDIFNPQGSTVNPAD